MPVRGMVVEIADCQSSEGACFADALWTCSGDGESEFEQYFE